VCQLAFADPSTLRKHKRTHNAQQIDEAEVAAENQSGIWKTDAKFNSNLLRPSNNNNTVDKTSQEITAKVDLKLKDPIEGKIKAKTQDKIVEKQENDETSEDHESDDDDRSLEDDNPEKDLHSDNDSVSASEVDEKSTSCSEIKDNGHEKNLSDEMKSKSSLTNADSDDEWIEEWLE
jgi:hypothetical protein